ncbi:MAG: thrombospondin type 3 repeat-containing protein [Acidobacteriota bacterium]
MTLRISFVFVLLCVAASLSPAHAEAPASTIELRDADVRALMLVSYVDGVDREIAHRWLSDDDAPRLAALLAEPDFERKDNLVAFLSYLDHPAAAAALSRFEFETSTATNVDDARARALLPSALRRIANRQPAEVSGDDGRARSTSDDPARLSAAPSILLPDPASDAVLASLTYANHVEVSKPMSDERLDRVLEVATSVVGRSDFKADVSCCFLLDRAGSAGTFGVADDGLDTIDTQAELDAVLALDVARVKIVKAINFCNGRKRTNVLGCSPQDGRSIVLVRMTQPSDEAVLWLHELGKNAGLDGSTDSRNVMAKVANATNRGLTAAQCAAFHALTSGDGLQISGAGACDDIDGDGVHTLIDNCPTVANAGQGDLDLDGTGDFCEEGTLAPLAPESGVSVYLDEALEMSWTRGAGQIQMELQFAASAEFKRNEKLVSSGFQFFPTDKTTPSIGLWQTALKLGKGEAPIYWRVRGKSPDGKASTQTQEPRAILLNPAIASTVTEPPADCEAPNPDCTFDIDKKDAPLLKWEKNHNQRYRILFAGNPEFTGKTFRAQRDYSLFFTAWKMDGGTWSELRKRFWQEGQTSEIWFRIEARDALARETTSPPARLFMADLPEPPTP